MKRKILTLLVAMIISLSCFSIVASGAPRVSVTVDGNIVNFPDAKPYVDSQERILIPVRFVTEDLGANVNWNNSSQEVHINKGDENIIIKLNERNIKVNNSIVAMDTKAIFKGSRIYIPIRYVAEALGATVKWDSSSHTVVITTGASTSTSTGKGENRIKSTGSAWNRMIGAGASAKSKPADYYRINPDMPQELYNYDYITSGYEGWYETNKFIINKYGLGQTTKWMNDGKNYVEKCYNVDYRNFNKQEYIDTVRYFFMPGTVWVAGDGDGRLIQDHLKYLADKIVEKEIIMKIEFITDPSLVVTNGHYLIRGRVIYTIEHCNDMVWFNKFFPFGSSELGKEHIRDMEIEMANKGLESGWEHSVYVMDGEYLIAIIE